MQVFLIFKKQIVKPIIAILFVIIFSLGSQATEKLRTGIRFDQKSKITLTPESVFDSNLILEGDFFSALTNEESAGILNLPIGSRLVGTISEIKSEKGFGRDAEINVSVTEVLFPDGSRVKASGQLKSKANWKKQTDNNAWKNKTIEFSSTGSKLLAGSLVGAVDSIQYGGIGLAISTGGISTLAAAGLGLTKGLFDLGKSKGKQLISSGFYSVPFEINSELKLLEPKHNLGQALEPFKATDLGINLKVNNIAKLYSKDFGDFLVFNINLTNHTDKKLFLGDFILKSNKNALPILNNPLISNDGFKSVDLESSRNLKISFSLGQISRSHQYKLMIIDAITQEIIANADVDISSFL